MKIFKSKLLDILKEYKVSVDSIYFLLTQRFLINSKSANLVKFHVKVVQNLNLLKNNLRKKKLNILLIKSQISKLKERVDFKIANRLVLKSLLFF